MKNLNLPGDTQLSDILEHWLRRDSGKLSLFGTNAVAVIPRVCEGLSNLDKEIDVSTTPRLIAAEYIDRLKMISELTDMIEGSFSETAEEIQRRDQEMQEDHRRDREEQAVAELDAQALAAQAVLMPLDVEGNRFVLTIDVQSTDFLLKKELAKHFINKSPQGFTISVMDKHIIVTVPPRPQLNGWEHQAALYTWILGEHDSLNGFETRHLLSQSIVQYYRGSTDT